MRGIAFAFALSVEPTSLKASAGKGKGGQASPQKTIDSWNTQAYCARIV